LGATYQADFTETCIDQEFGDLSCLTRAGFACDNDDLMVLYCTNYFLTPGMDRKFFGVSWLERVLDGSFYFVRSYRNATELITLLSDKCW